MDNSLENRFMYHVPKEGQAAKYTAIREKAKELAYLIVNSTPSSSEQSLALNHLDNAVFNANAAEARHG